MDNIRTLISLFLVVIWVVTTFMTMVNLIMARVRSNMTETLENAILLVILLYVAIFVYYFAVVVG